MENFWSSEKGLFARARSREGDHRAALQLRAAPLRACSACAGDYEDPERAAASEHEQDINAEEDAALDAPAAGSATAEPRQRDTKRNDKFPAP